MAKNGDRPQKVGELAAATGVDEVLLGMLHTNQGLTTFTHDTASAYNAPPLGDPVPRRDWPKRVQDHKLHEGYGS
jgi:hypothetical protein